MPSLRNKRPQSSPHGFAGTFCIVCRAVTTWKVRRTTMARTGLHAFDDITCTQCGTQQRVAPGHLRPCESPGANPLGLAAQTTADRAAAVVDRLALEERLRKGTLNAQERAGLISEPFTELEILQRIKSEGGAGRSLGSLLVFLMLALATVTGSAWAASMHPRFVRPPHFMPALAGGAILSAVLACVLTYGALTRRQRVAAKHIVDRLARALSAVRPTPEELDCTLGTLRKEGSSLARVVSAKTLRDAIALLPPPSSTSAASAA